jgi:hypothetical protein
LPIARARDSGATVPPGTPDGSATPEPVMDYAEAVKSLPPDAFWSSSFGYPGVGGCVEYYRTPAGAVYSLSNGPYHAVRPFAWTVAVVTPQQREPSPR